MRRCLPIATSLVLLASGLLPGCTQKAGDSAGDKAGQTSAPQIQIFDEVVGDGAEAHSGDFLVVHYTGWIYSDGQKGRQFDSSRDRGEPWVFQLDRGKVIEGWDEGLQGMRVGGKRTLIIPPDKAYGDQVMPRIPPHSTLYFEVELLDIPSVKTEDLVVGDGPVAEEGDQLTVHYSGWLQEGEQRGKKFDSSYDRNQPFQFQLGAGRVIRGWDLGVAGMRVGGKRLLTVPPELAYGKAGWKRGEEVVIPPDATLVFEIQLLDIRGKTAEPAR